MTCRTAQDVNEGIDRIHGRNGTHCIDRFGSTGDSGCVHKTGKSEGATPTGPAGPAGSGGCVGWSGTTTYTNFTESAGAMKILLKRRGNLIVAFDADTHDELGVGNTLNDAIGDAVTNLLLCNDSVTIDYITFP